MATCVAPRLVSVTTSRDIDVKLAAKLANLPLDEFKALNPSFNRPVILGAANPQILLPFDNAERFQYNLNTYRGGLSSWTAVTVDNRERIEALAARLNIDADTIREINRIPKGMRLKAGSTVVVPRSEDRNQDISATLAESATMAMEPDVPDARRVVVRAGRRDTVVTLAHRYGVSAGQVQSWNKLSGTKLVAGQSLVLMVPARSAARFASAPDPAPSASAVVPVRAEAVRGAAKGRAAPRQRVVVEVAPRKGAAVAARSSAKAAPTVSAAKASAKPASAKSAGKSAAGPAKSKAHAR